MSYCRFSSNNWMSDVYTYEDVSGGWTTHVAGRRRPFGPVPDMMWGRISLAVSRWSRGRWDRDTGSMVYPNRLRKAVAFAWFSFVSWWHTDVHMRTLHWIPLRPIGLPFDGETFNDPTPGECADRLEWLRGLGYRVPPGVIEDLRSESSQC